MKGLLQSKLFKLSVISILLLSFLTVVAVAALPTGKQGLFMGLHGVPFFDEFFIVEYIDSVPYTIPGFMPDAHHYNLGAFFKVNFDSEYTYTFNAFFDSLVPAERPIIHISDVPLPIRENDGLYYRHNVESFTFSFKTDSPNENTSLSVTIPAELNNLSGEKYVYIEFFRSTYGDDPAFTIDRLSLSYVYDPELTSYNQTVLNNLNEILHYGGAYEANLGSGSVSSSVSDHKAAEESIKDMLSPLQSSVADQKLQLKDSKNNLATLSAAAVGVNSTVTDIFEYLPAEVVAIFGVIISILVAAFILGLVKK